MTLTDLQPNLVWQRFYEITRIPRPSGHTQAIAEYTLNFAENLRLEAQQDEAGNILIRKPATAGMETRKAVILQAHLDMVPQKNSGTAHNFETDPIETRIEGNLVKARHTTLGGDNGIGMALALAALQSNELKHGNLEVLFTNDEETGMFGASGLQPNWLKGDVLINLDSEDEGELFIGCAGGINVSITLPLQTEAAPAAHTAYKLTISGLRGGHSGTDIHLERANSNKLLFRLLKQAAAELQARVVAAEGGNLRNAIPREATATVLIPNDKADAFLHFIADTETLFRAEYEGIEDGIALRAEAAPPVTAVLTADSQQRLIDLVTTCPHGAYGHITQDPQVVETSNNLAIVITEENKALIQCLLRSSVESRKAELCSVVESVARLAGAQIEFSGSYPGWRPRFDSPILHTMTAIYTRLFGTAPKIKIIHAGLECGIIGATYPNLDMISIGPTIKYPHSPDEELHIDTVEKCWRFLIKTLEKI